MEPKKFDLNDVVTLKKIHPCGSYEWKIIRTGADIRIECVKCGRRVLIPRLKFQKMVKKIKAASEKEAE